MNDELKEIINQKIQDGEFEAADLANFFTVFCQLGNEIDDLQEEVEGWNRVILINLEAAGSFWLKLSDGKFTNGTGKIENANLFLTLDADLAAQIFIGEKDAEAALNAGELKIAGDLPDAMKFHELLELVLEEIEY